MPISKLLLDPKLELSPEELVKDWNSDPTRRSVATAQVDTDSARGYIDPLLAGAFISFVVNVAGGLTSNLILDHIRARRKSETQKDVIQVVERVLPDGERVFIAHGGEK